eukprot:6102560-Prymnesium_polylepis.1
MQGPPELAAMWTPAGCANRTKMFKGCLPCPLQKCLRGALRASGDRRPGALHPTLACLVAGVLCAAACLDRSLLGQKGGGALQASTCCPRAGTALSLIHI